MNRERNYDIVNDVNCQLLLPLKCKLELVHNALYIMRNPVYDILQKD